jgi:phosphatidylserine/phosphatidylglycerophosphate/cardiolipin synthase-like enzyme
MPKTVGKVRLYMGPQNVGGPDNLEHAIIEFISQAQKSLDIAVQELDSENIAREITNKRPRVRVRLVLEADYLRASAYRTDPWRVGGSREFNREIQDALLRSAAWVRSDFNPDIFHQKFIIRDDSAVLTGSTNFTVTGTKNNLNHIVIIEDKTVAKIYSKEFREIRRGHFGKLNEGHDPKPPEVEVSQIPIRVLFAPDHSPEMEIMKQMLKAQERIDFAMFTFAKSSGIDDTMQVLAKNGIKINGVMEWKQSNQVWAAGHNLVGKPNIKLYRARPKGQMRKLHHKLMVIDERVIIAGSFNYTGPANRFNDENIILLGNLKSDSPVSSDAQKNLASYALDEIKRIINEYGEEIV